MEKTGVLIVGALGTISVSVITGITAINRGLLPERGMIANEADFDPLNMVPMDRLVFGGWDIREDTLIEAARKQEVVPPSILEEISEELENIPVWPGALSNVDDHIQDVYALQDSPASLLEEVRNISESIDQFKQEHNVHRVVVVNATATEKYVEPLSLYDCLDNFEDGLESDSKDIRSGMLYAYAALKNGCAYVNFTPSITAEIPALQELAEKEQVPIAGKDGRTGQTLYKHVLGKMFKARGLKIKGWYSTNILGNADGKVLNDPEHSATKIASKENGLEHILGYHDFDHLVRIDYFPIRGDHKEAWDTIEFEGWLGEQMSMKVNWLGSDATLAAPLIIDLVRFMDHALRLNLSGFQKHLALFFKSPYQDEEYAMDEQYQRLLQFTNTVNTIR
ncbi:inositol-3-phosphate synthase [Virgibacillus sp. NKC19-3]|uniref:inositol-3-phosphate synthase n=1 Tax=Virgibacillus saliphilus TaxID=2831674 RepID=UPI001C9A39B3|nr:inositol-3-phosphate synthase [Virgibacillus sp. NKC19-3]MBY7142816.1 inositol-3-phosphate synthase [Virgibacillus sp. NKC19-3]